MHSVVVIVGKYECLHLFGIVVSINTCAEAAAHWGFGKHEGDLPPNIRNAPEGFLISSYVHFRLVRNLIPSSTFGSPSFHPSPL